MTYFPDYRDETDKLNDLDKNYIEGFRFAASVARDFFESEVDEAKTGFEKSFFEEQKVRFDEWMEAEEVETVCAVFDNADYIPEDEELKDGRKIIWHTQTKK